MRNVVANLFCIYRVVNKFSPPPSPDQTKNVQDLSYVACQLKLINTIYWATFHRYSTIFVSFGGLKITFYVKKAGCDDSNH